jgi:hypothetical protein
VAESAPEPPTVSKVLPRFLAALTPVADPVILDLGPVVGKNVAFLGERLSCKLLVEDLFALIETYARADNRAGLGDAILGRLQRMSGPVDGILCWDLFDYLDKRAAQLVASELARLLRPGGVLYGFFATKSGPVSHYTRFLVESPTEIRQRPYPGAPATRTVFVTRDITKMFADMRVTETVLLKSNVQEVMLKRTG